MPGSDTEKRNHFDTYGLLKPGAFGHSDPRNQPSKEAILEGFEYRTPITLFNEIWDIQLSDSIPKRVLDYLFHVFNLWLLGWFYYPLFTHADSMSVFALEIGLKEYYRERKLKNPGFRKLFSKAVNDGLFKPEEFSWVIKRYEAQLGHMFDESENIPERLRQLTRIRSVEDIGKKVLKGMNKNLPDFRNTILAHPEGLFYAGKHSKLIQEVCEMLRHIFKGNTISVWEMLYPQSATLSDVVVQAVRKFALSQTVHSQIWREGMPWSRAIYYFAKYFPDEMDKNKSKKLAGKHLAETLNVCFGKDTWVAPKVAIKGNSKKASFILVRYSPGYFKYKQTATVGEH